jgi:thiol-disulfide isomerase/thioredoxin
MLIPTILRNAVSMMLLWALAVCGAQNRPGGTQGGQVFPPDLLEGTTNAPEFPVGLDWLNTATPLRLKDLHGKFVLLDFWTYCCINCMHILPDLAKLEQKYAQELVVIGVHSAKFQNEKDTSQIRSAILRYGIHHPVVNDASFQVWRSFGVNSWPTVVLINPAGKVVAERAGEGVFEPFDAVLQQAVPYFAAKGLLKRSPRLRKPARPTRFWSFPARFPATLVAAASSSPTPTTIASWWPTPRAASWM